MCGEVRGPLCLCLSLGGRVGRPAFGAGGAGSWRFGELATSRGPALGWIIENTVCTPAARMCRISRMPRAFLYTDYTVTDKTGAHASKPYLDRGHATDAWLAVGVAPSLYFPLVRPV